MKPIFVVLILAVLAIGCSSSNNGQTNNPTSTPQYTYRIVNEYPHDRSAFTQGLVFHDGYLYEGTGTYGGSELRKIDLSTNEVVQRRELDTLLFGEGITILNDRVYQLTWLKKVALAWDLETFDSLTWFYLPTQGWGLTDDGHNLIVSDGTTNLYTRDPETFAELNRLQVYDHIGGVAAINELEWVNGEIWANIWQRDYIARISPTTGQIVGYILLSGIVGPEDNIPIGGVMNGIAYDEEGDRVFVTGKYWPTIFEIEVVPLSE